MRLLARALMMGRAIALVVVSGWRLRVSRCGRPRGQELGDLGPVEVHATDIND